MREKILHMILKAALEGGILTEGTLSLLGEKVAEELLDMEDLPRQDPDEALKKLFDMLNITIEKIEKEDTLYTFTIKKDTCNLCLHDICIFPGIILGIYQKITKSGFIYVRRTQRLAMIQDDKCIITIKKLQIPYMEIEK
ncbi:MAG: hypothetical protein DRP08_06730 [Candidatus Aenigmatarchaeota archaeon]|nr:MAG: hypothetical protein DRP08_06730 [Candidatus Aenigmarchaeota archaeon]